MVSRARDHNRCTGDAGVALIEFALVLPLFMVLLLGIVSTGLLWNTRLQVAHATREGARYASTVPVEQAFVSGTWATNMREVVVQRSAGDLALDEVCVALVEEVTPQVWEGSSLFTTNADGTPCYDDSATGDESMRVQVAAGTTQLFETGLWSKQVSLDTRATARHEQGPS